MLTSYNTIKILRVQQGKKKHSKKTPKPTEHTKCPIIKFVANEYTQ